MKHLIILIFFVYYKVWAVAPGLWDARVPTGADILPMGLNTDLAGSMSSPPLDEGAPWDPGSGGGDPWTPPANGGEDPDNCYYCDGDSDTEGMDEKNQGLAQKLGFELKPSVMVDADGYTYVINLSENSQIGQVEPNKEPVSEKGFKVIKMRRGGLSIGVSGELMIPGYPGVAPNIGISIGGSLAFVQERHVPTYAHVRRLAFIKFIPTNQKQLNQLAVGDSITFLVSGTIAVHAGIILGVVSGGVEADVTGEWVANVRKVGQHQVQVAYTRGKIGSVSLVAGSLGAKGGIKWYKELTETQAYEFDLSKPDGWKLYRRMLRGDVRTVKKYYLQELVQNRWTKFANDHDIKSPQDFTRAAANKWKAAVFPEKYKLTPQTKEILKEFFRTMTVQMITIGTRQTQGTAVGVRFGVPIFFGYNWNTGDKSVVIDSSREVADGLISTNYYGVYKESKGATGVWTKHENLQRVFIGGIKELTFLNPLKGPTKMMKIFGQVKYEYHREKWNKKFWPEKLREVSAFLGFRRELLEIERPYAKTSKFGQQTADLLLGQKTFLYWMDWAKYHEPDPLIKMATWKIEQWFSNQGNSAGELCRGLVRPLCKAKMTSSVKRFIPKALASLKEMDEFLPKGDEASKELDKKLRNFSKAMADFGKSFTENQFILNTFLDLGRPSEGDQYLVFQWQGSHYPRGSKVLIPSKFYRFKGHQICGIKGEPLSQRCDSPTNADPM